MSEAGERRLTAGQFAALMGINKRTLLYYDNIGLFSPAAKGENGYRYYTLRQLPALEMLLTLRELDMSIEDIRAYMENRSEAGLHALLAEKLREVESRMGRLREIRALLKEKQALLERRGELQLNKVERVELPAEYLAVTRPILGVGEEQELGIVLEHTQKYHEHRLFNHAFGSMIQVKDLYQGKFTEYCCYFTRGTGRRRGLFQRPGGQYLRLYWKGAWESLPGAYALLLRYAGERGLRLKGFAYQVGVNELAIMGMEDYITQIEVQCQ